MNIESLSVLLAVIAFFGVFASLVAWEEARSDRIRRARFAPRYDDYVNEGISRSLAASAR
jgi:hypothetical protein